ncbi:MAG: regulatory signaling modulator protein AmpE [Gammaproteobacteria bacterium]|nr:regulatory signaling modulator protein AmpE [Gammaproteobacteria bacterium]
MALLTIIIALFMDRVWGGARQWREYQLPFNLITEMSWVQSLVQREAAFAVVFALLPLLLVVALLQVWLDSFLWDIPGLVFSIFIVLYCIGINDLTELANQYRDAMQQGDDDSAYRVAGDFLGVDAPEDLEERGHVLVFAVLVKANVAIFSVLFWFLLLGPLGAVLVRSVLMLRQQNLWSDNDAVATALYRMQSILNWIPARLLAFSYALSGNFDLAFKAWKAGGDHYTRNLGDLSEELLIDIGGGALSLDPEKTPDSEWSDLLQSAIDLVWRSLFLWIVVLSLVTITGWVD